MPVEDVVGFPEGGRGEHEQRGEASVEVAFCVEPLHVVPIGRAALQELLIVAGDVRLAVVLEGREFAVVLEFVFQRGEVLND